MNYVIWSEEHGGWWEPGEKGYTRELAQAGRYPEARARELERQANQYCVPPGWNEVALPDPLEGW